MRNNLVLRDNHNKILTFFRSLDLEKTSGRSSRSEDWDLRLTLCSNCEIWKSLIYYLTPPGLTVKERTKHTSWRPLQRIEYWRLHLYLELQLRHSSKWRPKAKRSKNAWKTSGKKACAVTTWYRIPKPRSPTITNTFTRACRLTTSLIPLNLTPPKVLTRAIQLPYWGKKILNSFCARQFNSGYWFGLPII